MSVCVGGTFDVLHIGHKKLLAYAAALSIEKNTELVVGVTSDFFANSKRERKVNKLAERFEEMRYWLEDQFEFERRPKYLVINDGLGPAANRPEITDLVVSEETRQGAEVINELRIKRKIPPVEVHVIAMELDANGKEIHASRIINGEIDPDGKLK